MRNSKHSCSLRLESRLTDEWRQTAKVVTLVKSRGRSDSLRPICILGIHPFLSFHKANSTTVSVISVHEDADQTK